MRMRALGVHFFRSYREVGNEHKNAGINRAAGKLHGMSATVLLTALCAALAAVAQRPQLTLCFTNSALHGIVHFSFAPPG